MFDFAGGVVGFVRREFQNIAEEIAEGVVPVADHRRRFRAGGGQKDGGMRLVMNQSAGGKRLKRIGYGRHLHFQMIRDLFCVRVSLFFNNFGNGFQIIFKTAGYGCILHDSLRPVLNDNIRDQIVSWMKIYRFSVFFKCRSAKRGLFCAENGAELENRENPA